MKFSPDAHKRSVAARFSAAAETYPRHDAVQRKAARDLAALLPVYSRPKRILDVGAGAGLFTGIVAARFPGARIDAIDISEAMMRNAPPALRAAPNVRWITADLLDFRPAAKYGLAVSSSALHWIYPMADAFKALKRLLVPGGTLVCSIMLRGTLRELIEARRAAAPHKPAPALLPTKSEALEAAVENGFAIEKQFERRHSAVFPDAAALLKTLNEQGVTGGCFSVGAAPLTRTEMRNLAREYESRRRGNGGVIASYRVLCMRALSL